MKIIFFWFLYKLLPLKGLYTNFIQQRIHQFCLQETSNLYKNLKKHKNLIGPKYNELFLDYFENYLELLDGLIKNLEKPLNDKKQILLEKCLCCLDENRRQWLNIKTFLNSKELNNTFSPQKRAHTHLRDNCYCCSQPLFTIIKKEALVVENRILDVFVCQTCKEFLKESDKLKILHFFIHRKRIHWSKYDKYLPANEYWNINALSTSSQSNNPCPIVNIYNGN
jgi:hypothetical protein